MRRGLAIAAVALGVTAPGVTATHNADEHSANVREAARVVFGEGLGDIAFWGDLAVASHFVFDAGATHGFSVIDISDPVRPRPIKQFACTGAGWDVSVWEDLVFLSVEDFTPSEEPDCGSAPGEGFKGIKIVSIADPSNPRFVGAVPMECSGSHANTVVPDLANGRLIVYTASLRYYDEEPGTEGCDHIIEVPLADPSKAKSVGALTNDALEGCHDIAVYLPKRLLAGACQYELRLYDITDLTKPVLLSTTTTPTNNFQHSAAFSNDGNALVSGEENLFYVNNYGAPTAACPGGTRASTGVLWFFDISSRLAIVPLSYYQLERAFEAQSPGGMGCDVHNFNTIPNTGERDLLSAAWYGGGMNVIDFTDLLAPKEVAYYQPSPADAEARAHYWAAYFYRGYIWATNSFLSKRRTLDVYKVDDPNLASAYRLPHMNPQTQEALVDAPAAQAGTRPVAPTGPCARKPVIVKVPKRAKRVRAYLVTGTGKRALPVRNRTTTVDPSRLSNLAHAIRVTYRLNRKRHTIIRRIIGCRSRR